MEPGAAPVSIRGLARLSAGSPWLLPAVPTLAALILGAAGARWGWFDHGTPGMLLLVLEGALANVAVLAAFLEVRERVTHRRQHLALYARELRHLRAWDSAEGILRKVGLIRDLNALGAAPRDLQLAVLAGADLPGCDLRGACLRGADLRGANLQGALLDGADLTDADLSEANLALASLTGISARGVNLEGAALTKALLGQANLSRANLVNTNLHGTDLRTVTLDRARFAEQDAAHFGQALHPSVDDWIRERLDARGHYVPGGAPGNAVRRLPKASAG
jgi:uncharacterized protein YjbI with pentapeptide repeats